jgi:hypothetical protein
MRQPNPNQFTTEGAEDTESKAFLRALRGEFFKMSLRLFPLNSCPFAVKHDFSDSYLQRAAQHTNTRLFMRDTKGKTHNNISWHSMHSLSS